MIVYVPATHGRKVRDALAEAGAEKIGGVSTFGQKIFGGLKKTVGGIFDGVGNLGKMLSPIDTAAQSFDAMGGKIEKIKEIAGKKTKTEPKLPTPQEILKKEKTTTEFNDNSLNGLC
jgi:hypothetical protein